MGRAPCCDKANVKKGPWSPEEDAKLKSYIEEHGTGGNWIALPQKIGLKRCGKSCRLRWLNYLRPNIKHGGFSEEEDNIICSFYNSIGSRWSIIASQLPGRTDNDIKNYWNTRLKKKLLGKQRKEQARRAAAAAGCVKQEMKRESDHNINYLASLGFVNQTPYWPQLPLIMPPSTPNLHQLEAPLNYKDQASLKNLLIQLGGRFSDDHQQTTATTTTASTAITSFQYPFDVPLMQDQVYASPMPIDSIPSSHNNVSEAGANMNNIQELEDFPLELSELLYSSSQQQPLDVSSLGSFYGMEMINGCSTVTSSTESSISWGDVSTVSNLVYNRQMVSDYEACQQSIILETDHGSFEESKYFGPQ